MRDDGIHSRDDGIHSDRESLDGVRPNRAGLWKQIQQSQLTVERAGNFLRRMMK
jgi:hypothetical protein